MRDREPVGRYAAVAVLIGLAVSGCSSSGDVVTVAGGAAAGFADGIGSEAAFNLPTGIAVAPDGTLYVSEFENRRIRRVSPSGEVTTIAGTGVPGWDDGPALEATFRAPAGLALDGDRSLVIADFGNNCVRELDLASMVVTTIAGVPTEALATDGPIAEARFWQPTDVFVESDGTIVVLDGWNNLVRRITADRTRVETVAGSLGGGYRDGTGSDALFLRPMGITGDGAGGWYVADTGNHVVRHVTAEGEVTTALGAHRPGYVNGAPRQAEFNAPSGLAFDGATLWIADRLNAVIRAWDVEGDVRLGAGVPGVNEYGDGPAGEATFVAPADVAMADGTLYVVSQHAVRALRI